MVAKKSSIVVASVFCGFLITLASGCGGSSSGDYRRYVPSGASARQALEEALAAWQRGEPAGKLQSSSTAVEVVDTKRPAGQKLVRFEILNEEAGEGPRWFTVRLVLEPQGETEARYVVIGRDPIWVFRDAYYVQTDTT